MTDDKILSANERELVAKLECYDIPNTGYRYERDFFEQCAALIRRLATDAARLSAEREAAPDLLEALEPFAKLGRMLESPFAPALFKDDQPIGVGAAWRENGEKRTITFGDLRRAATAIARARGTEEQPR